MKQLKTVSLIVTLSLFYFSGFAALAQGAGSISGTVSNSGTQTGPIYVVAFTSPLSCAPPNPEDYAITQIPSLGSYTIPDLPDGTYYVASAILACGTDCDLQPTDPWGVYGGCDTSTPVVINGGNAVSGINITMVDGTAENPNPFYDPYEANAVSRHENGEYRVWLDVEDEGHSLTSVSVTGPGLAGWIDLFFNQDRWELGNLISFGSTHPAPPLTYTFTIIDSEGTHFRTEIVESFVDVFATDLSPAGGEPVAGTPVLSWTGVGDGYTYGVGVYGNGIYWGADELTSTSGVYGGPPLTVGQTYNWYVDVHDVYDNLSQARSSFVYVQPTTLSVIKDGSGNGTVTSSPEGIDCGEDCSHDFPEGSTVILSAAPDTGSAFTGWSGGGCGGINYCVPELSSATTVTATFVPAGGSISGTVSYSGSQEGPIYVVLFTSPISCSPPNPDDYAVIELPALGSYSFPDLLDGTYYVASAILNCGTDCDLQPTDPWGVYGGCDASAPVVLSGGNAESGIDITLVDGTIENPNPFYDPYEADADSRHENDAYWVWLDVEDNDHNATSVSVTGPGISGSMDLVYEEDNWEIENRISFGSTHPAPPLTYTFTIIDSEGTHIRTRIVESFVDVFATDLSPAGGEPVAGTPVFSWTGVGDGYTYEVRVYSNDFYWDVDDLTSTSVEYNGPPLTVGQTYHWCVEVNDAYGNMSKTSDESFVYTQAATLTVVKDGSGTGTVTSSPAGIDCGIDCENEYPAGSQVVLTAAPDTGSAFASWSGGGCNGIGDCIPDLSSDTIVTATFTIPGTDPITLSVSPESVPADSFTGFTFQTRAASEGGTIFFELFHDFNNNGVIDGNEWSILEQIFTDNKWIDDDDFLSGDANSSVLQITIDFDFAGGLFAPGDYIARVTNTISESATVQLTVTPVSTSQSVGGYVYEEGTTTPVPDVVVYAINPATDNFVSAAFSAGDGSFSLLIPEPGDVAVGSDKDGYISDDNSLVTVPADGTVNQNVYLILPDSQITGTVTEYYTGNPVWGMWVDAEVQDDQYESEVVTDINGNFSLPALAGMSWEVEIEGIPGYFGGLSTYNFESHPVIVPTVSGPNRVDFTVHKVTAWIDGTILDEYGNLAVEGANLYVNRINTSDPALQRLRNGDETDASGQATVGIEQGDWRVGLYLGRSEYPVLVGGLPKEMVSPGEEDILNLVFGEHRQVTLQAYYADGAVEGTVYEADGITPAADVSVNAHSDNALNGPEQTSVGQINTGTRTDANGHFRLPLLSGTWEIKVWFSDGTEQVLQTITLTTDGNDIIDQPEETITGIDLGVAHINVTPTNLDFGNVTIGATSAGQILTISNTGSRNLEVSNIELSGTDYNMFDVISGGCQDTPFTLSPNSNCALSLAFSPTSDGLKSALVRISSNDTNDPVINIPLDGTGAVFLYLTKQGSGSGTVTSSPQGIFCGDTCVSDYSIDTEVTLTAIPDAGSAFSGWSGDECSGTGPCTLTMDSDKNVIATFALNGTITIAKEGSGSGTVTSSPEGINCGSDCQETYDAGTLINLSAVPDPGSFFVGWEDDECSGSGDCDLVINRDKTIKAIFALDDSIQLTDSNWSEVIAYQSGDITYIQVADQNANADPDVIDNIVINITSNTESSGTFSSATEPVADPSNVGDSIIEEIITSFTTLNEEWVVTCVEEGTYARFSVIGSVSGTHKLATENEMYTSDGGEVSFTIQTSWDTDFALGDTFTFSTQAGDIIPETVTLSETDVNTGIFRGSIALDESGSGNNDGDLDISSDDTITTIYLDRTDEQGNTVICEDTALYSTSVVEGNILQDTTWASINSPYLITQKVIVYPDVTLIIEPGTKVMFLEDSNVNLYVQGELIAKGTPAERIIFTSSSKTDCSGGLVIAGEANIENCNIEFTKYGIHISNGSVTIRNNIISKNWYGIEVLDSSVVFVEENIIQNNSWRGIYSINSDTIINNNKIKNNGITGNNFGIYCDSCNISNNTISRNQIGISCNSGVINNNRIIENKFHGILCSAIEGSPPITINYNTVRGNEDMGIFLRNYSAPIINQNNIYANSKYDIWNETNNEIDARNNWWGESVTEKMALGGNPKNLYNIYDYFDDNNYTPVDYSQWLSEKLLLPPTALRSVAGNEFIYLNWTPGLEANGYKIYYGPSPGIYEESIDVGTIYKDYLLEGLVNNTIYYIAVKLYDGAGNESDYSAEVTSTPSASDGIAGFVAFDKEYYNSSNDTAVITLKNKNLNTDPASIQDVSVKVISDSDTTGITINLSETGPDSGIFTSTAFGKELGFTLEDSDDVNKLIRVADGVVVNTNYEGVDSSATMPAEAMIDTSPPETTLTPSDDLVNYMYNLYAPLSFTYSFSAKDSTSGVERIEYRINDGPWIIYIKPFSLSSEGSTTISYKAVDKAGNWEEIKSKTIIVDGTPPPPPTGLVATQVDFQVNLTWVRNSEGEMELYNIYRDGTKINSDTQYWTEYSDLISSGKTYVYNVTAVDVAGNESAYSQSVSVMTASTAPVITDPIPGTPLVDSEITVRGNADPGSTVEIFVNGISQGTTIASSTGAFSLTGVIVNEGENSITAVSTNAYGETSPVSEEVTVPVNIRPPAPQGIATSPGDTVITITWDIVSEPDVQGYNIFRDGEQINNNLLTETTYTDVRLTNGRSYSYTVTAVDANGSESNKTNTITVTPVAGPEWQSP